MFIYLVICVLVGLIKKQGRRYWFAVLAGWILQYVAGFLFAAGGSLQDSSGDGVITAMVRASSHDGALVAALLIPAILLAWVIPGWWVWKHYERKAPEAARLADPPNSGRR